MSSRARLGVRSSQQKKDPGMEGREVDQMNDTIIFHLLIFEKLGHDKINNLWLNV